MSGAEIRFGDRASIKGDVVGGDKYEIRFFLATSPGEKIEWSRFQKPSLAEKAVLEPYKFLSHYETTDAGIFYGREAVSSALVSKISSHRLVLINGRSGSGKTSLINAGLVPPLVEAGYFAMVFRDYGYPTQLIRNGLQRLENLSVDLSGCSSLHEILSRLSSVTARPLVIFLDQFERFFTGLPIEDRSRFVLELKTCFAEIAPEVARFVFSIREDFYGRLGEFWNLFPELHTLSYPFYLEPLTPSEARDAIRKPLNRLPWKIGYEASFLDDVLLPHLMRHDGSKGSGLAQPAQLQIICNRLYEEAREEYAAQIRNDEPVTIGRALYDRLGGAEGILEGYLDEILAREYGGQDRVKAQSILKQMTSAQGTRVFASVNALSEATGMPPPEVQGILVRLEASRLIEVVAGEDKYSLTHEYLAEKINSWYDEQEMGKKRALELFNRSLQDYRARGYWIPSAAFRDLKGFRSQIPMTEQGRQLYSKSAARFYGIRALAIAASLVLLVFAANQSYHLFYLVPNQFGRLRVHVTGEGGGVTSQIVQFRDGQREVVDTSEGSNPSFLLKRGLYYAEVRSGSSLAKTPVWVEGYSDYRNPITLSFQMPQKGIEEMVKVPTGKFQTGSPRFLIGKEALAATDEAHMRAEVVDRIKAWARGQDGVEWERESFLQALQAVLGKQEADKAIATVLKHAEPPSDDESLQQRTIQVDDFYIDKHEVSNREYALFLEASADHSSHYNVEPSHKRLARGHEPKDWDSAFYRQYSANEDSPVVNIDWYDAYAYCAWKGRRLPTDMEWEKAAGWDPGNSSISARKLLFPWGDVFGATRANTSERWKGSWTERHTTAVEDFPTGASPYGALNLSGNAFEWTDSWYEVGPVADAKAPVVSGGAPQFQALRGGSFAHDAQDARTYRSFPEHVTSRDLQFGFRCAVSTIPN